MTIVEPTRADPAALLDAVRTHRRAADTAEAAILQLAVTWAEAHPAVDGDDAWEVTPATALPLAELDTRADTIALDDPDADDKLGWIGIPPVAWAAPATFAAANNMTTTSGKALMRDALVLRHRLPLTWARVTTGDLPAWRARRVAQAVLAAPADVVTHIDHTVAPLAHTIGVAALDRRVAEATLWQHAEALELDQAAAPDSHEVTVSDAAPDGSADLHAHGDWKDLHDLDQVLSEIAAALHRNGETPDHETHQARRARALGVLADPARAAALLAGIPTAQRPQPRKQAVLFLHLSDLAVLDLATEITTESYAIPQRLHDQITLTHPTCLFPHCDRPARACDTDHIDPWDPGPDGGPTASHNLAPLCRHHHRLKTHAAWTYVRLDHHVFLWTDPHGTHYLRTHHGTRLLDPPPPEMVG